MKSLEFAVFALGCGVIGCSLEESPIKVQSLVQNAPGGDFICTLVDADLSGQYLYTQEELQLECAVECRRSARRLADESLRCFFEGKEIASYRIPKRLPDTQTPGTPVTFRFDTLNETVTVKEKELFVLRLEATGGLQQLYGYECHQVSGPKDLEIKVNLYTGVLKAFLLQGEHEGRYLFQCEVTDGFGRDKLNLELNIISV